MRQEPVLLGPRTELHPGIHGALLEDPPAGVEFRVKSPLHVFVLAGSDGSSSPFTAPHFGEFIDFSPGPEIAYSASWPVLNRRAWVCELSSFGYTAVFGRFTLSPEARATGRGEWPKRLWSQARQRTGAMVSAYAHPSCRSIMLRTHAELGHIRKWLRWFNLENYGRRLIEKCAVIPPASPPCSRDTLERKWADRPAPLRIVFCGRDYEVKNGAIALQVFEKLYRQSAHVKITYIGYVPQKDRSAFSRVLRRIDYHPALPREQVLELFASSHVLFHPVSAEAYGMVMVEAAAAGMVVVAARRKRVAVAREIFDSGGAVLLEPRRVPSDREVEWFTKALQGLSRDRSRGVTLARQNWNRALRGELVPARRKAFLHNLFSGTERMGTVPALTLQHLHGRGDLGIRRMSGQALRREQRAYCASIGLSAFNVVL